MSNIPPTKPGLYWAKLQGGRKLHLIRVTGDAPFMTAIAFNVESEGASSSFRVYPYKANSWQWLGEANAPKEDGA